MDLFTLNRRPRKNSRAPQKRRDFSPAGNRLGRVAAVFEGVLVTPRSARRHPPMDPAAAVRHRR